MKPPDDASRMEERASVSRWTARRNGSSQR
jgi:hypothetical protein